MDFLFLLASVTVWTYGSGKGIAANTEINPKRARGFLIAGVALNLSVLAYFKYFNFGVRTLNSIIQAAGGKGFNAWEVILPIGISFYLFQAISYLVDVYRKDAFPATRYIDLAAYISLFPQLIAGPILRYKDIAPQLKKREHSFEQFSAGALRFMLGFSKKVLIADSNGIIADLMFGLDTPTLAESWIGVLAFTAQIYFDFSGYSDMAIGLGRMMGFRFKENFDRPYISRSITEFWRRWHISLSSWLRDYLYIPLGGNRKGVTRTYINLMIVMFLGGLWHGAAWTFVVWGAWHGILLAGERYIRNRRGQTEERSIFSIFPTMFLVITGWVLFRADDFTNALSVLKGMAGLQGIGISSFVLWQLPMTDLFTLLVAMVLVFIPLLIKERPYFFAVNAGFKPAHGAMFLFFLLSIIRLSSEAYSPFLYFRF